MSIRSIKDLQQATSEMETSWDRSALCPVHQARGLFKEVLILFSADIRFAPFNYDTRCTAIVDACNQIDPYLRNIQIVQERAAHIADTVLDIFEHYPTLHKDLRFPFLFLWRKAENCNKRMIALGEAVSVEKRICSIYLQIIHTYVAGRSLFPNKEQHPLRQPPLRSSNVEVVWQAQAQCDPESCIADLETVWESEKRPGYSEHLYDLSALLDKVIIYHAKEENISEEMIAKHARLEQKTADLQHFLFTLFALYDIIADIGEPEAINSSARLIKLIDKVKPVSNQSMAYHHLIDSFFNQY